MSFAKWVVAQISNKSIIQIQNNNLNFIRMYRYYFYFSQNDDFLEIDQQFECAVISCRKIFLWMSYFTLPKYQNVLTNSVRHFYFVDYEINGVICIFMSVVNKNGIAVNDTQKFYLNWKDDIYEILHTTLTANTD